jgi:Fic family protein
MPLENIIQACLLPRLLHIAEKKPEEERQRLTASFQAHVRLLSEFMQCEFMDGPLSISALVGLHTLLFPPDYPIRALGNDGVPVEMRPGEWRKQVLHPYFVTFSSVARVEEDLKKIIGAFNQLGMPRREDIFRFYLLFGKVHPFGDANGTLSALVCDVLCFRHGLLPFSILNIRFKDKSFGYSLVAEFEANPSDQSLTNILRKIDAFHRQFPVEGAS